MLKNINSILDSEKETTKKILAEKNLFFAQMHAKMDNLKSICVLIISNLTRTRKETMKTFSQNKIGEKA
jgi:hypothetical protein